MLRGLTLAALLIAPIVSAQTPTERYVWPLDLPRELTSSFGEYRPGRYHMGIDLRTGPIGKNVHAAADGYVSRIRCSPYGYGKAVYLQLADGNSAVYAHLSDFSPALDDFVRAEQHRREQYEVDLTPKPGEFPIKRSELLAKSGQTGIGVPHLHYELRDRDGVAINPRSLGVKWPDHTPPVIEAVTVTPLSPRSLVNGTVLGSAILKVEGEANRARVSIPVGVEGPVGFAIRAYDPAEGGSRLGIFRATLQVAGREVFTVRNDRISYDHTEDGAVAFEVATAGVQFLRLWRAPGNEAEPYSRSPTADGAVELQVPEAEALITVEDFAGNASMLSMRLMQDAPTISLLPGYSKSKNREALAVIALAGQWLVATAAFPGDEPTPPLLIANEDRSRKTALHRIGARAFQLAYAPDAAFADLRFVLEHPRLAAQEERIVFVRRGEPAHRIAFGDLEVKTQPDSPYGTLALQVREIAAEQDAELQPVGTAYDLEPKTTVVGAPIMLSLPLPAALDRPERALIYRRDVEKKRWVRQDTKHEAGRAVAATRQLGVYALLEDSTPPQVEILRPTQKEAAGASRRPALRVRAEDKGSGVDTWRVTYNGRWLLTEYDPEENLLTWEQDEDLPIGPGTLAIEVRDHAGNLARAETKLTNQP